MIQSEFYPMKLFVKLHVPDVTQAAQWFEETLGFYSVFTLSGKNEMQIMNHIRLGKYQDLMLIIDPDFQSGNTMGKGMVINLLLDTGINLLAKKAEAFIVEGPSRTNWNTIEFTVEDPHGYRITFSQAVDINMTFEEVMGK